MRPAACQGRNGRRRLGLLASLALAAALAQATAFGQARPAADEPRSASPTAKPAGSQLSGGERLAVEQEDIAAKFERFEQTLLRMAELTAPTDPKRASLLRRAVALSKEQLIDLQFDKLVDALKQDKLAAAVTDQESVEQELAQLLELLLSEQRGDKLKDERERLKRELQQLKELINKQVELKAETGRAPDLKSLAPAQGKLAEEAGRLAASGKPATGKPKAGDSKSRKSGKPSDKSDEQDKGKQEPKVGKSDPPDEKDPSDKPKSDDDKQRAAGEPKSGKPSPGKPGETGKPEKSKPEDEPQGSSGKPKPAQGQPTPGQQGQPMPGGEKEDDEQQAQAPPAQTEEQPGKKRIAAAQERMQQAQKQLDDAKREKAEKEQEEALRELEKAKAELEEILRQLRDEEVERVLAQLEARFRHMLALQREVYEGTKRLDAVPAAKRGRGEEIEAARLSRKEALIVIEAEKTLTVLRDEGSAVAMPEAVEQMRDDMESIVARLGAAKIDITTLGLEEDVIAALEEMIAALEKAQRDRQSGKPPPGGGMGMPQEPPLVDKLSELKMIRALQMRVNTRTQRYAKLVQGDLGQAETEDLLQALAQLAEREQRIYRTTRDIVIGKNQ